MRRGCFVGWAPGKIVQAPRKNFIKHIDVEGQIKQNDRQLLNI